MATWVVALGGFAGGHLVSGISAALPWG
ncbi:cell envelope biogenesis protein OmpA, partial [Yersinia pestis subsp. pestis]|nr:cell envelope biogenesis protein OmpA [Yersinia pestis subsp. pestis]